MRKIFVPLDFPSVDAADTFVAQVSPDLCGLKVGFELFLQGGAPLVKRYVGQGFQVFLDLKFHDIPNTVAAAAREATLLGVTMFTLHAAGGRAMIEAAMLATNAAARESGRVAPKVLAVTVLTSLDDAQLAETGVPHSASAQVMHLAALALSAGATGLVCSAMEAQALRAKFGAAPALVTPGIRLAGGAAGDQARVVTPTDAMQNGATVLVIGRPITQSTDPVATLKMIAASIE